MARPSLLLRISVTAGAVVLSVAGLSRAPAVSAATEETIYVSPSGIDGNAGTSAPAPLRTLQTAQAKVCQALSGGFAPSAQVAGGTYELSAALTFGPADWGTVGNNGGAVTGLGGTWATDGEDLHSQTANPQFTAGNAWTSPAMLDYTVASASAALGLGFANFPMNTFGVPGAPAPPPVTWPGGGGGSVGALRAAGAGKCLDDPGGTTTGGTQQQIWSCNGQSNQQWNLNSNGTITGAQSGPCLDVTGAATADGTLVELWTCNGGSNQQWTLG